MGPDSDVDIWDAHDPGRYRALDYEHFGDRPTEATQHGVLLHGNDSSRLPCSLEDGISVDGLESVHVEDPSSDPFCGKTVGGQHGEKDHGARGDYRGIVAFPQGHSLANSVIVVLAEHRRVEEGLGVPAHAKVEGSQVLGSGEELNQSLEKAGRVADFFELAELICRDALDRNESCGGHFREEYQTSEGEAARDDEHYAYAAAWEFRGVGQPPVLHKEPLTFEYVHPSQRSYK